MAKLFLPYLKLGSPALYSVGSGSPPGPYTTDGVVFASSSYLNRAAALTGLTDGDAGTVSFWFWLKGGNSALQNIITVNNGGVGRFSVYRDNANPGRLNVFGRNSSNTTILFGSTSAAYNTGMSAYAHFMASWDLSASALHIYVDGVSDVSGTPTITSGQTIDYSGTDFYVGASIGPAQFYTGWLADLYFTNTYLDLSDAGNRLKFYDSGTPVDLGSDGSTPTGTQPLLFLKGPAANFTTNLGSGGNFSVAAGSITDAATDPP